MGLGSLFDNFLKSVYTRYGEQIASQAGIDQDLKYFYNDFMLQTSPQETKVDIKGAQVIFQTPGNVYRDQLKYNLETEKEVLQDILNNSKSNDVLFDIGANIGMYTCTFGQLNPQSKIYSFEPMKSRRKVLKRNIQINNVNAEARRVAISNQRHTPDWIKNNIGDVEVQQGDNLVEYGGVNPPNILKIDIEGGELSALQGLKETISREECRHIYCEIHKSGDGDGYGLSPYEIGDLYTLLENLSFEINHLKCRGNDRGQDFIRADKF